MKSYIFEVALNLYGSTNTTFKQAEEIVKLLEIFGNKVIDFCSKRVSTCVNGHEASELLKNQLLDLSDFTSEQKMKTKLKEMDLYGEFSKFTIAN